VRNNPLNPPGGCVHDVGRERLNRIPGLALRWRAGEFDAAEFAARYFFLWQMALHGPQFAARQRKRDPRPDATECLAMLETAPGESSRARLLDWLDRWQFRGVTGSVPVALAQWLRGAWPLVLREDIPSPLDVLRLQARGRRAVTALTAWPRVLRPVLNKPDAFAFFRHDLEHGYKFFHSPALYAGQRGFFAGLEAAYDRGVFTPYFGDAGFVGKFHYLMSDMNTHPEHGRQYLRAILIEFHLRRENRALTEPLSPAAERDVADVLRAVAEPAFRACA
jgi:hypothetical protein